MLLPAGLGQWSLYVNAYAFGIVALSFGLPQALTYHIASKKLMKEQVLVHSLAFALIIGLAFMFFIFCLTISSVSDIFLPNDIPIAWLYLGLGCHFTLLLANQILVAIFHANKKFITAAAITAGGSILLLFLYASYYCLNGIQYQEYFFGFILGNIAILLAQLFVSLYFLKKALNYSIELSSWSRSFYKPLIVFASWIYVTNLVQFLSYKMDVWFISAYVMDDKQLGIYTLTASLSQLLWLLPTAFHSIIFTDIAENNSPELRSKIGVWTKRILALSLSLGIIGYFSSFILVPLLFGEAYKDISTVLPYILPGIILFSGSILHSAYFSGINRIDLNFKSSMLGFIFCLALNYLLIPSLGIIGAALSSTVAYSLSALYLYYKFSKE